MLVLARVARGFGGRCLLVVGTEGRVRGLGALVLVVGVVVVGGGGPSRRMMWRRLWAAFLLRRYARRVGARFWHLMMVGGGGPRRRLMRSLLRTTWALRRVILQLFGFAFWSVGCMVDVCRCGWDGMFVGVDDYGKEKG